MTVAEAIIILSRQSPDNPLYVSDSRNGETNWINSILTMECKEYKEIDSGNVLVESAPEITVITVG